MTTRRNDHSELVEVLTELLGFLGDLFAIEPNTMLYPQPNIGLHVHGTTKATAASSGLQHSGHCAHVFTTVPTTKRVSDWAQYSYGGLREPG